MRVQSVSFAITASEYEKQLTVFGMDRHSDKSVLRFYWAFKDSQTDYNREYDYGWEGDYFTSTFTYDEWAANILDIDGCQVKEASITRQEWFVFDNSTAASNNVDVFNLTESADDPFCKYDALGFDKLLVTEVTVQWYSRSGMKTCFKAKS